jgi:hypothetical protein
MENPPPACLAVATSDQKLLSVFASLQPPIRIKLGLANVVPDPRPFFLREQAKSDGRQACVPRNRADSAWSAMPGLP